jgi:hypothetical protein
MIICRCNFHRGLLGAIIRGGKHRIGLELLRFLLGGFLFITSDLIE